MALVKCKECGAQVSSSTKVCPQCGKKRTTNTTKVIGGLFIAAVLAVVFVDREPTTGGGDWEPGPSQVMRDNLSLDYSWTLGDDRRMHVEMTLENGNDFAVKDVLIACTTYAPSDARLDRLDHTVRDVFPSGLAVEYSGVMGVVDRQSDSASCRVVDASRV